MANKTPQEALKDKIHGMVAANNGYVFKGADFSLRPFREGDLPLVEAIYSDAKSNAMVAPVTENNQDGYARKLGKFIASYNENGISCYVLADKEGKELGTIGLTYLDDEKTKVELNAVLLPEYQNKGILSKFSKAFFDFSFNEVGLEELYGESLTYNFPSQKLMQSMGMKPVVLDQPPSWMMEEGYYKDNNITRFKITKDEWVQFKDNGMKLGFVERYMNVPHPDSRTFLSLLNSPEEKKLREAGDEKALKRESVYNDLVKKGLDPNFGQEESIKISR